MVSQWEVFHYWGVHYCGGFVVLISSASSFKGIIKGEKEKSHKDNVTMSKEFPCHVLYSYKLLQAVDLMHIATVISLDIHRESFVAKRISIHCFIG